MQTCNEHLQPKELTLRTKSMYFTVYWKDFKEAINHLAKTCQELGIVKLALPKIGAGLDRMHGPKSMRLGSLLVVVLM